MLLIQTDILLKLEDCTSGRPW